MSDLRLQEEQDRAYNEEQRLRREAAATAYAQNEAYDELADENAALRERVAELEGVVHRVEADLGHTMVLHEDYDLPAQLVSAIDYSKTRLHAALAASKRAGGEGE